MLTTEFIPARDASSKALFVILHGLGDSLTGFRWLPKALSLPWMNYLLVNAPDRYYSGYSWYDFSGDQGAGVKRSRQSLFDLLDHQREKGFPTNKTILGGFSQGCLMTFELGMYYPHLFAGLVGISGYVHEPDLAASKFSSVARQQRFLVTHGFQDPIIPFAGVKQQIADLVQAGLKIRWEEFAKAHTIAGESEINLIRDFIIAGYPEHSPVKK